MFVLRQFSSNVLELVAFFVAGILGNDVICVEKASIWIIHFD